MTPKSGGYTLSFSGGNSLLATNRSRHSRNLRALLTSVLRSRSRSHARMLACLRFTNPGQCAVNSIPRSSFLQRTANYLLTVCPTPGGKLTQKGV